MKKALTPVTLSPEVTKLVNMTVTKSDVLVLFEESLKSEIEKQKQIVLTEKQKLQEEKKQIQNSINNLIESEKKRICKEYTEKINSAINMNLVYTVKIIDEKECDIAVLRNGTSTNEDVFFDRYPFSVGPMITHINLERISREINIQIPIPTDSTFVEKIKDQYKKMELLSNSIEKVDNELSSVMNELYLLPDKIKKFSSSITRKTLDNSKEGKAIITLIDQLVKEFKTNRIK